MAGLLPGSRLPEEPVDFSVLGPLQVRRAGVMVAVPGQPERQLLAALLRFARQPVSMQTLIGSVWPATPPPNATRQVRADLALLRQLIGGPNGTIVTLPSGDVTAEVEPGHLDAERFLALLAGAERSARAGALPAATRQVCDALHQWRGPALTDVTGELRDGWVTYLTDQRRYAVDLRFDIELRRGHHAHAVAELTELVEHGPVRAHLIGLLMLALHGSGHRDDALRLYERTRACHVDGSAAELGRVLAHVRDAVLRTDTPLVPMLRLRPAVDLPPAPGADLPPAPGAAADGAARQACA